MKKPIISTLKVIVPLGLGIFLIWLVYSKLSQQEIEDIKRAFEEINYFYLFLSVLFGVLSHASRAWRWKYPLNELGYQPKFFNSFFAVMIGYFVNLGIPRSGELLRCGVMAKYEDMPFNKLVGTVIAERVADLILLLLFILAVIFIQFETLKNYLIEIGLIDGISSTKMIITLVGMLLVGVVIYVILNRSSNKAVEKIKGFIVGILDGLKTIMTMKGKWLFIGHTLFIWIMYMLMFYITFFSLKETQNVPIGGVITAFVIGGISIAATNGGIGAYPLGISQILLLYGVAESVGYAFGWAVWTAQTIMIVTLGLVALVLMPKINQKKIPAT